MTVVEHTTYVSFIFFQRYSAQSNISGDTLVHLSDLGNKQVYTKTGYYKATLVAIKKINKTNINVAKPLLMEFKRVSLNVIRI